MNLPKSIILFLLILFINFQFCLNRIQQQLLLLLITFNVLFHFLKLFLSLCLLFQIIYIMLQEIKLLFLFHLRLFNISFPNQAPWRFLKTQIIADVPDIIFWQLLTFIYGGYLFSGCILISPEIYCLILDKHERRQFNI